LKKASIVTRKTAVATVMGTSRIGSLSKIADSDTLARLAVAVMQHAMGISIRQA
jgi:hypothetical protein